MNKQIALYMMIGGALVSGYELVKPGAVYGAGKPLESMRIEVYKTAAPENKAYYVSVSDAVAVIGAFFYFR